MAGFAKLGGKGAAKGNSAPKAPKIILTIKDVVEENDVVKLLVADSDGKEFKLLPKNADRPWNEDERIGSVLVTTGLEDAGNGEFKAGFVEWINRYPGMDVAVKAEAVRIAVSKAGNANVMAAAPSAAIDIKGPDDVASAITTAPENTSAAANMPLSGLTSK